MMSKNMVLSVRRNDQITKVDRKDRRLDLFWKMIGYLLGSEMAAVPGINQTKQRISGILKTTEYDGKLIIQDLAKININQA